MKSETPAEQTFYGKDCPKGMVQVEFVGCDPKEKTGQYGWKPTKEAFLEIYVDGRRFRIEVGDFHDGTTPRRGLHIITSEVVNSSQCSANSVSIYFP